VAGVLAAVVALLAACGGRAPERRADPAALAFALVEAGRARVVVDGWTPDARVLESARAALERHHGASAAAADDDGAPRCVLATSDSATGAALLAAVGARPAPGGGFEFMGERFDGDLDSLRLALPDPEQPGLPLTAFVASRPAALALAAELCEFSPRALFECRRAGRLVRFGVLSGAAAEVVDDVEAIRANWSTGAAGTVAGLSWRAADAAAPAAFERELVHLSDTPGEAPIGWTLVLHTRADDYARVFGTLRPLVVEPLAREVHRLHVPGARLVSLDALRLALADGGRDLEVLLVPDDRPAPLATRAVDLRGAALALPRDRRALAGIAGDFAALAELGADTVVLRHHVALSADPSPSIARTWRSAARDGSALHAPGEIWFAAAAARAAGLAVGLEPLVLNTPTSDLVARRKRADAAARASFAEQWADALEIEARLATRVGARLVVLGSDLPTMTRTRVEPGLDPAALDAAELAVRTDLAALWAETVRRVRTSFEGAVVYVARDLPELERAGFVADLDAVGLQHHPTLHGRDAQALRASHAHALERARDAAGDRPLLLVGVQTAATRDALADGRVPRGPLDEELQAASLAAFAQAFAPHAADVDGLLLVEWTVEPARRGGRGHDLRRTALVESVRTLMRAR
jgi:hypothetical protein